MSPRKVKRLFWDIETSPDIAFTWRIGSKVTLLPDNIIAERAIICLAYKWQDDPEVHVLLWDKQQSDKALLKKFLKVAAEADELVAHNGDRYDIAWLRTRCLFHKLGPLPSYKTVDTLAWAKRLFYFNSNKLDYIAQFLGLGNKLHTGFSLWRQIVLDHDPVALSKMSEYCQHDVVLLEQVWQRLSEAAAPKTHAGVLLGGAKWQCPHCGSTHVIHNKVRVTAAGTEQHQMRCGSCARHYTISADSFKEYETQK